MRTVGVEEEFLVVDAHLDDTRPTAAEVLLLATPRAGSRGGVSLLGEGAHGSLVHELTQQQLESNTAPHETMASLEGELVAWRSRAASAARRAGAILMASGTAPVPVVPLQVHTERYDRMVEQFGVLAREHLTCGCHVHVAVASLEEAVGILDRIRTWLPPLLALSANSPFWQGAETDYAAYRAQVMRRWPASGPLDVLGSAEGYRALVESMIATGVLLDEGMVYFDARPSVANPTVEIRVPDVCLSVGDTVLVAALCRGLVETAAREWAAGVPAEAVPTELVRLATWQAARWGLGGDLLDPTTSLRRPARDVVATLVGHIRPALRAAGDEGLVDERVDRVFARGTGAARQRAALQAGGRLDAVVAMLLRETIAAP
jgi:carboxylate-amine ligase